MNDPVYSPGGSSGSAPDGKSLTIGLVTTGDFARFAPGHWHGVIDAAQREGVNVICFLGEALQAPQGYQDPFRSSAKVGMALSTPGGAHGPASAIFDLAHSDALDGLIIWSSTLNWFVLPEVIEEFVRHYDPPVISVEVPFAGIASVLVDDYEGMYQLVSHLIEAHSCRRIAFLRGFENHYGMHERYRGYLAALADHSLALDPSLVAQAVSADGRTELMLLLDERGLRPGIDIDAVVGWSGGAVSGIHGLLEERGIQVPGDVAVAGFDDPAELAMYLSPYTMVDPQVYAAGGRAVELLLAGIRGQDVPARTTVPSRLVVRRSCGCPNRAVTAAGAEVSTMPRAARPVEHDPGAAIQHMIALRGEELLSEIAEQSGVDRAHVEAFIAALSASVRAATPEPFLAELEVLLHQSIAAGMDALIWHRALSALRQALPLFDDVRVLSQLEYVWQQAHVLISEAVRQEQAYQAMHVEQRLQMLREVESALVNTYDLRDLADVLGRCLASVGIPSALLSLYEHQELSPQHWAPSEYSRLILSCDEGGRVSFDPEGQRFRSCQLAQRACSRVTAGIVWSSPRSTFASTAWGSRCSRSGRAKREPMRHCAKGLAMPCMATCCCASARRRRRRCAATPWSWSSTAASRVGGICLSG